MKKKMFLATGLLFGLIVFQWVYNHSFIDVSVTSAGSGDLSYTLTEVDRQNTIRITKNAPKLKRLVRRGNYEVLVSQNDKNAYTIVKAGGFLTSKAVSSNLELEKQRQFVGNNPSPCMRLVDTTLLSYGCYEPYRSVQIHVPATAIKPTYQQKTAEVLEGRVEGMVTTNEGTLVLLKAPPINEDQGIGHTIYTMQSDFTLSGGVHLGDLNESKAYSLKPYKDGFIAHDSSKEHVLYYPSAKSKPTPLPTDMPEGGEFKAYALDALNDTLAVAYTNSDEDEVANDAGDDQARSEVVLTQDKTVKRFRFKETPGTIRLCGNNKLCVLRDNLLEVFDVSGTKQKLLFGVSGVDSIERVSSGIILLRQNDILSLDVDKQAGSVHYTLNGYEGCGLQPQAVGYVLCLVNSRGKKVALYINPLVSNMDSIDKKVAELLKLSEVKDLSVYRQFITVSPELGEAKYIPELRGFSYDKITKDTINGKINQEINRLGIDRNTYKIRFTIE